VLLVVLVALVVLVLCKAWCHTDHPRFRIFEV
jgi:hypothetical protein